MHQKWLLVWFVAAIVVVVGVWGVLSFSGKKITNQPNDQKNSLTGMQLAQNMTQFLDKTIRENGDFSLSYYCKDKDCYVEEPKAPPHSGQIVMFYKELGQKTGNTHYKEIAQRAIDVFYDRCMEEADICQWNFFPLYVYFKETGDQRYKEAMLRVADEIVKDRSVAEFVSSNFGPKLVQLYEITGEEKYKNQLINMADRVLSSEADKDETNSLLYKDGDFEVHQYTFYQTWSTLLPTYQMTKDKRYLDAAIEIFEKGKILDHLSQLRTDDNYTVVTTSIESYLQLAMADSANKDAYTEKAAKLMQEVIASLLDSPQTLKFNGDWGYVSSLSSSSVNNHKDTLQNAWIGRQLLRMSEQRFVI